MEKKKTKLKKIKIQKTIFATIKLLCAIILILITPFILPVMLKILISCKVFESIEQFKEFADVFNNGYSLISIIVIILLLMWFFYNWDKVEEFLKDKDIEFKWGDKGFSAKKHVSEEIKENNEKTKIAYDIRYEKNNEKSDNAKEELIERFSNNKKSVHNQHDNQLAEDRRKIRFSAAYNIINADEKYLLDRMYEKGYMWKDAFKDEVMYGYMINMHQKGLSKKEIYDLAESKYNALFMNLMLYDIIEPAEDERVIQLTSDGEKFVKEYIRNGVVE